MCLIRKKNKTYDELFLASYIYEKENILYIIHFASSYKILSTDYIGECPYVIMHKDDIFFYLVKVNITVLELFFHEHKFQVLLLYLFFV